ncbi:MAG: class I SAM-dependent methyltransferase [Treponemataceae bacterium]|nr:class I SAM-dependent methyltransferase [Treponemataceae bacterium]
MTKADIIAWFDEQAANWDDKAVYNPQKIHLFLDSANVRKGKSILEVGCGTGNLIPFILERNVADITAVDFSPEMIVIAQEKFRDDGRINIMCADIMETHFSKKFDSILLHNTLPFIADIPALLQHLKRQLVPFGTLCFAQDDFQHSCISHIDLAALMTQDFKIQAAICDDERMYVTGIKK